MRTVRFALLAHNETQAEQMVAVCTRFKTGHSDVVFERSKAETAVNRIEGDVRHS